MDFDDFQYELETSLDEEIDSVRSEYSAMFDLVEKKMPPIKITVAISSLLSAYNKGINKSIKIVERFIKEINGMWDYSFEDYVKNTMERDPDLKKDDISDEWYMDDMQFMIDDYLEHTADQDLVQSIKDAKEWEWDNEYEFGRKFKKYIEDLYTINNNLQDGFQEVKQDSMILIFEE